MEEMLQCVLFPDDAQMSQTCARQCFGIIHEHLNRAKLSPISTASDIHMSPTKLCDIISGILADISSSLQTGCRCFKMEIVNGVPVAIPKQCLFKHENIAKLNDHFDESLSKGVTKMFTQVFKAVASKFELRGQVG